MAHIFYTAILHYYLPVCLTQGVSPIDFCLSIIVPLPKNKGAKNVILVIIDDSN